MPRHREPMPFELSILSMGWIALVATLAGVVRGYSGFGFAAIILLGAGLVANPVLFVPVVVIADLFLTAGQAQSIRREIDWRRIMWLAPGAVISMPLGVAVVARMGDDTARLTFSLLVLAVTAVLWTGWRTSTPLGAPAHVATGVVSGVAQGASLGGLPVAAFFAAQPLQAQTFRATIIAFFFLIDLVALPLMSGAGLVTIDTGLATAILLPFMAFGVWYGSQRFRSASPEDFRRYALVLLTILALAGVVRGLA